MEMNRILATTKRVKRTGGHKSIDPSRGFILSDERNGKEMRELCRKQSRKTDKGTDVIGSRRKWKYRRVGPGWPQVYDAKSKDEETGRRSRRKARLEGQTRVKRKKERVEKARTAGIMRRAGSRAEP